MCGIAGLVGPDPGERMAAMLRSMEHRGRDDEGVWTSGVARASRPWARGEVEEHEQDARATDARATVCLGHRRLSIIDTSSAGHQPMLSASGRFVITLNGEIYNYREVRRELEARQHTFRTQSDTEVLLSAWEEWGVDCLPRLNGMFAFAIWDNQEQTLTLVRDRVGIKPLYYSRVTDKDGNSWFAFASEIKAILAAGIIEAEINTEALNQYLTFLWTPDPHTLFKDIWKLPPGHYLTLKNGQTETRQWWDVSFDEIEEGRTDSWWSERLMETLERVVDLEMVADVPVGSFLSGGVDSSSIVALMKRHTNGRRVSTYTVGMSAEDLRYDIIPDDVVWARRVSEFLKTDYHEIMLKADLMSLLPKLIYHADEPIADPAMLASYLVSESARETQKVMLSGMGGDEVFAGYPRQLGMKIAAAFDPVPQFLRRPLMNVVATAMPAGRPGRLTATLRNAKKFARSAALEFQDRYLGYGTYFTDRMKAQLYTPEMSQEVKGMDAYQEHRRYFATASNAAPLNQLLYVDLKTFLPCLNLAYTDKTSMAANLEVRVPFVNHVLMEFAARMPVNLKLRGLKRKYIFKRMAEQLLPHDVVWRKKAGFGAPIRAWLRGPLRPLVADLLSEETIKRRGLFNPGEVKRIIDLNASGHEDLNLQIYQLLTLELWQRQFIDR
ncbi:MAG TPA: asparagine synthase (glutamine-hydrolyzing) [Pyrinomonadaceae bacterium]|nr:asparagine synthase (glutamine-hydrolyzing) [Pyrinomonadaceae bacterium]